MSGPVLQHRQSQATCERMHISCGALFHPISVGEQAVATRRMLLQNAATDSAAVVQVQMTGTSENQTTLIAQELGTVVSNTNLQVPSSLC